MSLKKSHIYALLSFATLATTAALRACPAKVVNKGESSISVVSMGEDGKPSRAHDLDNREAVSFGSSQVKANFFVFWSNGDALQIKQIACTGQMDESGEMAEVMFTVNGPGEVLVPDFAHEDNKEPIPVGESKFLIAHTLKNAYDESDE